MLKATAFGCAFKAFGRRFLGTGYSQEIWRSAKFTKLDSGHVYLTSGCEDGYYSFAGLVLELLDCDLPYKLRNQIILDEPIEES